MGESAGSETRVCCAYDGSVNGHWVTRYGINLASCTASRSLRLLHVRDRQVSERLLRSELGHVRDDCARAGVGLVVHELRTDGEVAASIIGALPGDPGTLLLCGTPAQARRRRLLSGTVAESLLRSAPCGVLALRVVLPGQLGVPRRVLMPVAGNPGEGRAASVVMELLAPAVEELHLLRVVLMDDASVRVASREMLASRRAQGIAAVTYVEAELRSAVDLGLAHVDAYARIAADWTGPTIVAAAQHRCGLVLAGASSRLLGGVPGEVKRMERLLAGAPCDVGILRSAR